MISFEQAIHEIRQHARLLATERITLADALGRVLAEDVLAPRNLPGFDNAAMDGFALTEAHLQSPDGAVIPVKYLQLAGNAPISLGEYACQIMTGAALPTGAATVVPVEDVEQLGSFESASGFSIRLKEKPHAGMNIRRAGEDVRMATLLCPSGTKLTPAHSMLLAAMGIDSLAVRERVKAAIICTGEELVSGHGGALGPGHIHNSNGPYLLAELSATGVDVVHYVTIPDEQDAYFQAVQEAEKKGCQLIVGTGAVSMGVCDFVPGALKQLHAEIIFHKVRMRPAKPSLFAVLPSKTLVFGLPGNPMSCAVGLRFFVQEAIRGFLGQANEQAIAAVLQTAATKKPDWLLFQKASLIVSAQAQTQVSLLPGQESFRIKPFVDANVWAVLPEGVVEFSAGDVIDCYPIRTAGLVL